MLAELVVEVVVEGVVSLLFQGRRGRRDAQAGARSALRAIPFRVCVSVGLVALGIVAMNMAFAGTGSTRPMFFVLTGVCLVLSPVSLLLPRRFR